MNAYCLFCNTMKQEDAAECLRIRYGCEVLVPRIIQRKWVKGTPLEVVRDFLPGYLFAFSAAPIENPVAMQRESNVLRCLGAPENGYRLQGANLAFARMLHDCGGTIGILKAHQVGDRVRLTEGALGGLEGEIIRLDRPKGRAQIEYAFDGVSYKTWVGYDLIEEPPALPTIREDGHDGK